VVQHQVLGVLVQAALVDGDDLPPSTTSSWWAPRRTATRRPANLTGTEYHDCSTHTLALASTLADSSRVGRTARRATGAAWPARP
jgi:hypothetical protein